MVFVVVLPVLIILIILAIVYFIIRRRRKNRMKRPSDSQGIEQSEVPLIHNPNQQTEITDQVPSVEVNQDSKVKGTSPMQHADTVDPQFIETGQVKPDTDKVNELLQELGLLEGKPGFASCIKRINEEARIKGVTVLKNNFIIATENSPALEVYDVNSFKLLLSVPVPQLINPFDIACCRITECIFISDSKSDTEPKEIIRLEPSFTVGKRWSTDEDCGNLSVFGESNIILCVSDKNMLTEFTNYGKKIRVITLSGVDHPSHAIKLNSGDFVVSHGYKNDTLHQVSYVNQNGEVKKSFGGERGTSLELLNEPKYLVGDANLILVVDSMNRRLLLLGSNLRYKGEFLTKQTGLLNPGKICLCKATRSLLVVDVEKQLMIFRIK